MNSRRRWVLNGTALVAATAISAFAVQYNDRQLTARLDGELLRISAPHFSFLYGKPLERLKDGASIAFVAQMTVSSSPSYVIADARSVTSFAISYDIWEERFAITKISDRGEQKRTVSHLAAPAAEAWCFDNLALNRSELPSDKPFYVQVDLRVEDPRDQPGVLGDSGISISRMVEIFSRPVREKQARWVLESGPLKLEDLARGLRG